MIKGALPHKQWSPAFLMRTKSLLPLTLKPAFQAGGVVCVERALANKVFAGFLDLDAAALDQALYRYFVF